MIELLKGEPVTLDARYNELLDYVTSAPGSYEPGGHRVIAEGLRRMYESFPTEAERTSLVLPLLPLALTQPQYDAVDAMGMRATDWLVREFLPAWLDAAGNHKQAARLRDLPAVTADNIDRVFITDSIPTGVTEPGRERACRAGGYAAHAAAYRSTERSEVRAVRKVQPQRDLLSIVGRTAIAACSRVAKADAARLIPTLQASAVELFKQMAAIEAAHAGKETEL